MQEALSASMVDTVVVSAHPSAVSLPKEQGHVPWALMVQWEILAECLWLYHADEVCMGGHKGQWDSHPDFWMRDIGLVLGCCTGA